MPVQEGMLRAESLIDGTVDLAFVALLIDSIVCRADNEWLAQPRPAQK
jgi:hypothetical protein